MKKFIPLLLSTVLACVTTGVLATANPSAKEPSQIRSSVVTDKKAPSFLFVVSADTAKITHLKGGQYSLVIQKSDLNRVIEFSDRPYRIVKYITGSELQKIWGEGKNSFAVDPPNAVLSAANQNPVIVVLDGMLVDKSQVTFYFSSTHVLSSGLLNTFSLVIDGDCESSGCCTWYTDSSC